VPVNATSGLLPVYVLLFANATMMRPESIFHQDDRVLLVIGKLMGTERAAEVLGLQERQTYLNGDHYQTVITLRAMYQVEVNW
jgi:hypothetical protein